MRPWQYYPDAEDVYPGAETTVQDEDTQPLEKPIIAPVRTKNFDHVEKKAPVNPYSMTYLHITGPGERKGADRWMVRGRWGGLGGEPHDVSQLQALRRRSLEPLEVLHHVGLTLVWRE